MDGNGGARKVMVVADPTRESAGALQYALSHAIVENDILILFHVGSPNAWKNININLNLFGALFRKPSSNGGGGAAAAVAVTDVAESGGGGGGGEPVMNFLEAMKEACVAGKPKLKVVVKAEMEGKEDKASVILAKSAAYDIDLLIVGHKKGLSNSILGVTRNGTFRDMAEYLILNSKCNCVAVQKKGQKGGYLISSKKHKNFWLLA